VLLTGDAWLPFRSATLHSLTSGPCMGMELVGPPGAVGRLHAVLGPSDPGRARGVAPGSVRARFGANASENAVHASETPQGAAADLALFFSPQARA
jgi:nucleoside-diphosphate kinase